MRFLLAGLVAACAVALAACREPGDSEPDSKLRVVASFYPLAELAQRVGGDGVAVTNLTAAGVEPHDLELTSRQVDKLLDADLVLYLGHGFQPAVADIAGRRDGPSVDLLARLDLGSEAKDPHFWLDPSLMSRAAGVVADELVRLAPAQAAAIRADTAEYQRDLSALDDQMAGGLATCRRRQFVTAHDAFGYLAARYRLEQLAVAGLSPEVEPDAGRLGKLADRIEATGTTTVFFEELVSPDVAKALARETGAKVAVLNPIEGLTKDEQAAGNDYATVMRDNLAALREALGCA